MLSYGIAELHLTMRELAANRRAVLIYETRHAYADLANQGNATVAITLHPSVVTIAHFLRNSVAVVFLKELGPIVRIGTAGAA